MNPPIQQHSQPINSMGSSIAWESAQITIMDSKIKRGRFHIRKRPKITPMTLVFLKELFLLISSEALLLLQV
jgi:hypothetical protein